MSLLSFHPKNPPQQKYFFLTQSANVLLLYVAVLPEQNIVEEIDKHVFVVERTNEIKYNI